MSIETAFYCMAFLVYFIVFSLIYMYVKKIISAQGFNSLSVFILTFSIFYFVVPFVQTFFVSYRDNTSLFTRMLNQMSNEKVFLNFLIAAICLLLIIVSYNLKLDFKFKRTNFERLTKAKVSQKGKGLIFKKINYLADILFILSVGSILVLIIEIGSLKDYLALGSLTRGLDKDPTQYISSSSLQLITLSAIILTTPYLYMYLYRTSKGKLTMIKLIVSLTFSVLFLFYNQGRAPIIIFALPFLFSFRRKKKKGFLGLTIVFLMGLFALNYLDALFNYLSYGYYQVEEEDVNFVTKFLSEFSYPFANFSLRNELLSFVGHRYMYDYIIWPFTMVPSSLLNIIGLSKTSIVAVSTLNTEAYGYFLGVIPSGGIPVDFLTFNFYQLGYVSLIFICVIVGRVVRKMDEIFYFFKDNFPIKVLLYRLNFSIIAILNNADISAIVRNRLDVVVLFIVLLYIYKKSKKYLIQ